MLLIDVIDLKLRLINFVNFFWGTRYNLSLENPDKHHHELLFNHGA